MKRSDAEERKVNTMRVKSLRDFPRKILRVVDTLCFRSDACDGRHVSFLFHNYCEIKTFSFLKTEFFRSGSILMNANASRRTIEM